MTPQRKAELREWVAGVEGSGFCAIADYACEMLDEIKRLEKALADIHDRASTLN